MSYFTHSFWVTAVTEIVGIDHDLTELLSSKLTCILISFYGPRCMFPQERKGESMDRGMRGKCMGNGRNGREKKKGKCVSIIIIIIKRPVE